MDTSEPVKKHKIDGRKGKQYRPQKTIDWDVVDKLLVAGCEGTEIAGYFDMHPATFYNRVSKKYGMLFTEYKEQKNSKGKSILRVKQFEKATKGDNVMLVWLGKNRLAQREKPADETEHTNLIQLAKLIVKGKIKQEDLE